MNWMDVLRTATFALRGNWMRSALTSLGVIIGIAAVIVMVSIGCEQLFHPEPGRHCRHQR